jgi:hypothetical protein
VYVPVPAPGVYAAYIQARRISVGTSQPFAVVVGGNVVDSPNCPTECPNGCSGGKELFGVLLLSIRKERSFSSFG